MEHAELLDVLLRELGSRDWHNAIELGIALDLLEEEGRATEARIIREVDAWKVEWADGRPRVVGTVSMYMDADGIVDSELARIAWVREITTWHLRIDPGRWQVVSGSDVMMQGALRDSEHFLKVCHARIFVQGMGYSVCIPRRYLPLLPCDLADSLADTSPIIV